MKNKDQITCGSSSINTKREQRDCGKRKQVRVGRIKVTKLKQLPENVILSKLPVRMGEEYTNKDLNDIYFGAEKAGLCIGC